MILIHFVYKIFKKFLSTNVFVVFFHVCPLINLRFHIHYFYLSLAQLNQNICLYLYLNIFKSFYAITDYRVHNSSRQKILIKGDKIPDDLIPDKLIPDIQFLLSGWGVGHFRPSLATLKTCCI